MGIGTMIKGIGGAVKTVGGGATRALGIGPKKKGPPGAPETVDGPSPPMWGSELMSMNVAAAMKARDRARAAAGGRAVAPASSIVGRY